ncbi:hypothetical protein [Cytophaga aurantiaca]|uniref:hypothetical protein n=1 Tax=Cytophaga aurantiaca TaxID=29530 RepID=UPI0003A0D93F|nr:hypothetical protein [Cytophaga aurantiaca]
MKRLIFVLCLLACLSACKKEHVEPIHNSSGTKLSKEDKLPKKVITFGIDGWYRPTNIQLFTYNAQGLVTKMCMYDSIRTDHQDSIVYTYNSSNQLSSKIYYIDDNVNPQYSGYIRPQIYTYNNLGKLATFQDYDTMYVYNYTATGTVDYIIRTNIAHTFQDSIQMNSSSASIFTGKGEGTLGSSHDYGGNLIEFFNNTENGVYPFKGIFVDPGMETSTSVWNSGTVNGINKEIKFQDEVASTIIPIGQAGYVNMYPRTTPYKYATHAEYLVGPLFNYRYFDASYTFDTYGRLTSIEAEVTGMPVYYGEPLSQFIIIGHEYYTKTIYY